MINRIFLIVLDSVGIGELPDADRFGDEGSNTIGNIKKACPDLVLPNMIDLGLGNIEAELGLGRSKVPTGAFGRALEASPGKDTTTGHWEIAGVVLGRSFPVFENGFPKAFMGEFERKIRRKTLANIPASGTVIIEEYGKEHQTTGAPIVYTSADSVFQIAMHEEIIPIEAQYEICQIARDMLVDEMEVGRVIARPFVGKPGAYQRTSNRKDYSIEPPEDTVLDILKKAGRNVASVGKIKDIFAQRGITQAIKTKNNMDGVDATLKYMEEVDSGLIFTNLVDFDMLFGHRNNPRGYADALMDFDRRLPELQDALRPNDLLVITADHGCDPTMPGTDHSREYIPILCAGQQVKAGASIGTRKTFADIGASIAEMLQVQATSYGTSFAQEILTA